MTADSRSHAWQFFRAGGFEQVRIEDADDLRALPSLDPTLWVATACPARNLEFDEHTLRLLDSDHDSRIRLPEVVEAVRWMTGLLRHPEQALERSDVLRLSEIDTSTELGKHVLGSAREVLRSLGKPHGEDAVLSPEDTRDVAAVLAKTLFNGDGIVPPEAAESDLETAAAIRDIIKCLGGERDASGLDGVGGKKVELFFREAEAHLTWWRSHETDKALRPLGDATGAAWSAIEGVRAKVDDFFARCSVAAMDPRAGDALNPSAADLAALSAHVLTPKTEGLAALPVARIAPGRALPLEQGINPAYAGKIEALRRDCIVPLLGPRLELREDEWRAVLNTLEPYRAFRVTSPATAVEQLGTERLAMMVHGDTRAKIEALLEKDRALEPQAKAIDSVDRLAHFHRHLATFLDNFVAFRDFYARKQKAIFQVGTLVLDARAFDLCLRVEDAAKHAALASMAMTCLVYCDCVRAGGNDKMSIVAAVTEGDSDFLMVGRNGVFFDRKNKDWDATITKIVEHPISLRQAFWSPYRRFALFVSEQIEKFGTAQDQKAAASMQASTAHLSTAQTGGSPTPNPPTARAAPAAPGGFDVARLAGVLAALGLALGAIGTALASAVGGFLGLALWQMPLALLGVMLLISGPSVLLAAMKLRKRNLGPLLDASGWAINARARINIPFGRSLTHVATLPQGSRRSLSDPFADRKTRWPWVVLLLAALVGAGIAAYQRGLLDPMLERLHLPPSAQPGEK